jgi:hypothetical protein
MKIGAEGKLVYVYRGDLANRAIQLVGMELQMFTERKEIKRTRSPQLHRCQTKTGRAYVVDAIVLVWSSGVDATPRPAADSGALAGQRS